MLNMMQQNQQMLTQMMQQQQQQQQQAQAASSSSSGSTQAGLGAKDLSKVLKHPPVFSCKNRDEELIRWPSWSWEFEQYLITLHKEFHIKKNPKKRPKQLRRLIDLGLSMDFLRLCLMIDSSVC